MKLGILQMDELPDDFNSRYGGLVTIYSHLLGPGFEYEIFQVLNGQVPDDLHQVDGYLLGGSRDSAYTDKAPIKTVLSLVAGIHREEIPLVGICFGHQAVALSLGGEVSASPRGWEVGLRSIELSPEARQASFFSHLDNSVNLSTFHHDEVTKLPAGAVLLASNEFSRNQAYALDNILCFQSHPEFTRDLLKYFIDSNRNNISDDDKAAALESLALPNDNLEVGKAIRKFLLRKQSFAKTPNV